MTDSVNLHDSGLVPWELVALEDRCWACGTANARNLERCRLCDRRDWRTLPSRVKTRLGTLSSAWQSWDDREQAVVYEPEATGLRFEMGELMAIVALIAVLLTVGRYSVPAAGVLAFWGVPTLLTFHRAGRRRREGRPMNLGEVVADFATMIAVVLGVLMVLALIVGLAAAALAYLGVPLRF